MEQMPSGRLIAIRIEIRERLRPVCQGWPALEFDELVEQVAQLTLKYERKVVPTEAGRRAMTGFFEEMRETVERSERLRSSRWHDHFPQTD